MAECSSLIGFLNSEFRIFLSTSPFEHPMRSLLLAALAMCFASSASGEGRVLFVIGSDTGLWTGLNVARYHCTLSGALYSDPTMNASRVMDPAFRSALTDRHGTPMKLTWWMMAGNMFRLSVNTDIPVPSTMPVYLMKRFHGERLRQWGDELTFHYHTWVWSDRNGDGIWYWNQAVTYDEFAPDFDQTLAEMLLEEEVFPVSFRSGWHAMNNAWQQRLDHLLPFSMHNDWPAAHDDPVEPVDNVYDWSRAPSSFIPFHPSRSDYQVPGNGSGWNLRSSYVTRADSAFLTQAFALAAQGTDQVVCLWAHLPETDFPENLQKLNAAVHAVASRYPTIDYRYCSAIEAMQTWLKTADSVAPHLTVMESETGGDDLFWVIRSDEPVFQPQPFVAIKDRYERYRILPLEQTGAQEWKTTSGVPRSDLARLGVGVTDTAGNLSTRIIRYLPDDAIVDNSSTGYEELHGSWQSVTGSGFDASFRLCTLAPGDSAMARWNVAIPAQGTFNISIRIPATAAPCAAGRILWGADGNERVTSFSSVLPADTWTHVGTLRAEGPGQAHVALTCWGSPGATMFGADAIRVSALVRERWVEAPSTFDAGALIVGEQSERGLVIRNSGVNTAHILSATTARGTASVMDALPLALPAMGEHTLNLRCTPSIVGAFVDTLVLTTDDPLHAGVRVALHGQAREYFVLIDDRDPSRYGETGNWAFSSAGGLNSTSRYAYPAPGVAAQFTVRLKRPGLYNVSAIVPTTVNASLRARYALVCGSTTIDSLFRDQNAGSGSWVRLWERDLPADTALTVRITDAMVPVVSGKVLRTDAVEFQWLSTGTNVRHDGTAAIPGESSLEQNYPNPFNPSTRITISLAARQRTRVSIYDVLGREITTLLDEVRDAGRFTLTFHGAGLSSGIYICRMRTGNAVWSRRMLLMK